MKEMKNSCSSIYIHTPFCAKKCRYCDFLSHKGGEEEYEIYFKYLKKELELYKEIEYDTVYFGGGTPSIVKAEIIEEIYKKLRLKENAEITIEVNPGTVNFDKLQKYKDIGINRLSIGCQSFDDKMLEIIGRIHNGNEAVKCYLDARKAGFKNINIDLMFALPGQTIEILENSLKKVIELSPEHISIYSLIWEEGTELDIMRKSGNVKPISEDKEAEMYEKIIDTLTSNGYEHYEISNFSKKGFESKHNLKCWRNEEYVGVGMGASGYVNAIRYKNFDSFQEYYNGISSGMSHLEEESVNENDKEEYKYILGFRMLKEGVKVTGKNYLEIADKLMNQNLIEKIENGNYVLTKRGLFTANYIFEEFLGIRDNKTIS